MMHRVLRWLLVIVCCTTLGTPIVAQSKSKKVRTLETQRKTAQRQAQQAEKELKQVQQSKTKQQNLLELTNRQLKLRQEYVTLIEKEIQGIQEDIDSLERSARVLAEREQKLIKQYVHSLKHLQRAQRSAQERLRFLLSSESLIELEERQHFLRRYALSNSKITKEIKANRTQVEREKLELDENKQSKESLQRLHQEERGKLQKEAGQRQRQLTSLQSKEKELSKRIQNYKRHAEQLDAQIEAQIQAEIIRAQEAAKRAEAKRKAQEARRRAQASSKSQAQNKTQKGSQGQSSTSQSSTQSGNTDTDATETNKPQKSAIGSGYAMDDNERRLSGSFAQNKGKLPSPVRGRYDLIRRFGVQAHSTESRVQINSRGIDLKPHNDKRAYAVFDGVVTRIMSSSGYNKSVMIRHGNYTTVYANLSSVSVSTGQKVKAGQAIGQINISAQSDLSGILHFQVWHNLNKLNPSQWIKG